MLSLISINRHKIIFVFFLFIVLSLFLSAKIYGQEKQWVYLHFSDGVVTRSYQDGSIYTHDPRALKVYLSLHYPNSVQAMFSEKADFSGSTWETYIYSLGSNIKEWQFSSSNGIKKLYIRVKDDQGKIAETNIQYTFDTVAPTGGIVLQNKTVGQSQQVVMIGLNAIDDFSQLIDFQISTRNDFYDEVWRPLITTYKLWPYVNVSSWEAEKIIKQKNGQNEIVFVRFRDMAENISNTYQDEFIYDSTPPQVHIEVPASDSLEQTIRIYAYDEFSPLGNMQISNDPLLYEGVKTLPYQEKILWKFDDRRVVWVKIADSVGNYSEPYPVYLASITSPTPNSSWTPVPSVSNFPSPVLTKMPIPTVNPTVAADPKYIEFQNKITALEKKQNQLEQKHDETKNIIENQERKISWLSRTVKSIVSFLKSLFPFWK